MRDMNFFAPMLANSKPRKQGLLLKTIFGLIAACIIIAPVALFVLTYTATAQIAEIKATLDKPDNVVIMQELQTKEQRLAVINAMLPQLSGKDAALKSREWFNEELLQIVIDTFPKQARMTTFSLVPVADSKDQNAGNVIEINGVATDKPAVAELERNLRKTGRFEDIFVSVIEEKEGILSYSVKFSVKEVGAR